MSSDALPVNPDTIPCHLGPWIPDDGSGGHAADACQAKQHTIKDPSTDIRIFAKKPTSDPTVHIALCIPAPHHRASSLHHRKIPRRSQLQRQIKSILRKLPAHLLLQLRQLTVFASLSHEPRFTSVSHAPAVELIAFALHSTASALSANGVWMWMPIAHERLAVSS